MTVSLKDGDMCLCVNCGRDGRGPCVFSVMTEVGVGCGIRELSETGE